MVQRAQAIDQARAGLLAAVAHPGTERRGQQGPQQPQQQAGDQQQQAGLGQGGDVVVAPDRHDDLAKPAQAGVVEPLRAQDRHGTDQDQGQNSTEQFHAAVPPWSRAEPGPAKLRESGGWHLVAGACGRCGRAGFSCPGRSVGWLAATARNSFIQRYPPGVADASGAGSSPTLPGSGRARSGACFPAPAAGVGGPGCPATGAPPSR